MSYIRLFIGIPLISRKTVQCLHEDVLLLTNAALVENVSCMVSLQIEMQFGKKLCNIVPDNDNADRPNEDYFNFVSYNQ